MRHIKAEKYGFAMSDVALNVNDRDQTIAVSQTSAAIDAETLIDAIPLRERLLRGVFLLAALIATGGWVWLLAWIGLSLLGY
jgi:hypothetical protein